jgi:hypothetical protein
MLNYVMSFMMLLDGSIHLLNEQSASANLKMCLSSDDIYHIIIHITDEHILWLDIAMYYLSLMGILQRLCYLFDILDNSRDR